MMTEEYQITHRSKLYILDEESEWMDQGTGFPKICRTDKAAYLKFYLEETKKELYSHEINDDITYEHQEDKIISWCQEKANIDMALSFQNSLGAKNIWSEIEDIKKIQMNYDGSRPPNLDSDTDMFSDDFILPSPTPNNLARIESELSGALAVEKKLTISHFLIKSNNFLEKLEETFVQAEAEKNAVYLELIYKIMKTIISFAEHELLELLLSDEKFLFVFGTLEYDPDMLVKAKVTHRIHFTQVASFQQLGDFKDKDVLKLIHFNYRLLYLRDCALGHFLDDRAMHLISQIINNNYSEIIRSIQTTKEILITIFDNLRAKNLMALQMMQEICSILKFVEVQLFDIFNEFNIFEALEDAMRNPKSQPLIKTQGKKPKKSLADADQKVYLNMILDILLCSMQYAPAFLQSYSISENQKLMKYPFLSFLCENLINSDSKGLQIQYGEIIKSLIDVDLADRSNPVREVFFDVFYPRFLSTFDDDSKNEALLNAKLIFIEILTFAYKTINTKVKEVAVFSDNFIKPFSVLKSKNKILWLSVIQLFKVLLVSKDQDVLQSLGNGFRLIMEFYLSMPQRRQNLIHSSILEMVKYVYDNKIKNLTSILEICNKGSEDSNLALTLIMKKFQADSEDKHQEVNIHKLDGNKKASSLTDFYQSNLFDTLVLSSGLGKLNTKLNIKASISSESKANNSNDPSRLLAKRANPTKLVDYDDDGEAEAPFEETRKKIKSDE